MDQSAVIGAVVLAGLAIYGYTKMFLSGRSNEQIKELLSTAKVIDVRTNEEYRSGHFSGAMNIPLEKLLKSSKRLGDKRSPLILYCASGMRARRAARLIRAMGYARVYVGGSLGRMKKLVA